jgi:hypothetical protein
MLLRRDRRSHCSMMPSSGGPAVDGHSLRPVRRIFSADVSRRERQAERGDEAPLDGSQLGPLTGIRRGHREAQ